jgi:hypothetical protein
MTFLWQPQRVTIGDGKRASFWETPWLDGRRPKDIAPLIYEGSNQKNCTVNKAMYGDFWIYQINTLHGLSLDHIVQFANTWEMLHVIHLDTNLLLGFDANNKKIIIYATPNCPRSIY